MTIKVKSLATDKLTNRNVLKKLHYSLFLKVSLISLLLLKVNFFFTKGVYTTTLFSKFFLANFSISLVNFFFFLIIILLILLLNLTNNNVNYNIDYFFALINIFIFIPLIYYTKSIYTFIFIIELLSLLIFYKFITSKYWSKKKNLNQEYESQLENSTPKNYLNMLFFQYWSTFFSSILLFYFLSQTFLNYGSTDLFFVNYINHVQTSSNLIWLPLILGFFLKIGFTPVHLFKIEVYKGLPFISLLVYTTLFFFIYFTFFMLLLNYYIPSVKTVLNTYFYIILILGIVYIISLLFDITTMKTFFAYSTIINSILFLCAIISI